MSQQPELVARTIFEQCQKHGIETVASFETWDMLSDAGRQMYLEIAQEVVAVINHGSRQ